MDGSHFQSLEIVNDPKYPDYPFNMQIKLNGKVLKGVKKCVIVIEPNDWTKVELEFVPNIEGSSFPVVITKCVEVEDANNKEKTNA